MMKRLLVLLLICVMTVSCIGEIAGTIPSAGGSEQELTAEIAIVTLAPTEEPAPTPSPEPSPTQEPTPEPTPTPTPDPTPTPTPTPEPTPDPDRRMVALTFDDGPNMTYTAKFLDVLEKYDVPGTFFVLGQNMNQKGADEVLKRMFEQGCEIGIHGLRHTDMKKLSQKKNEQNLAAMKKRLKELLGEDYVPRLMRPPYGNKNSAVLKAVKNEELACILWSVDTRDWSNRSKTKIVKIVKKEVKNGSIILFHDRIQATLEAIDELIPWLKEEGYDLVTVSELLESAAPIEYGKSYRQKNTKQNAAGG